ncbi:MAG: hypothetical protein ACLU9S_20030 [Oscillospiraceae bacterium]
MDFAADADSETLEANSLTRQQRHSLVPGAEELLWCHCRQTAGGRRPLLTSPAGSQTGEVNPKTMESKRVPGLYFAGEIFGL